jgi:hypothetical protein
MKKAESDALKIATRALSWYANKKNWREDDWGVMSVAGNPDYGDPGGKARRALTRISKTLLNGLEV